MNSSVTPLAQTVADKLAEHIARVCAKNGIKACVPKEFETPVGSEGYEHVICVPVPFHGNVKAQDSLQWDDATDEDGMALESMGDDVLVSLAEEIVAKVRRKTFAPSFAALYLPRAVDHTALGRSQNIIVRIVRSWDPSLSGHRTRVDCLYRAA